ncbi:MAG: hypothetical protein IE885_09125 [Campylobacterales bacterium]|nr:hypothetical protein [Campylobacterales bacterium]
MKKNILISLLLFLSFFVNGCGSNSKPDGTSSGSGNQNSTLNYQLVAVPDVIDVTTGGETANIDLYLNDMAALEPVEGRVIKAQVFDQTKGTLDIYEVTTDDKGHAPFVYKSPNNLPATSLTITFEVKDGVPALDKNVTVNFNGSTGGGTDVNTTDYQLVAVPDVIDIAEGGETANIDLYLNNTATLSTVPNTVIKAQVFNQTNGTLDTYEVKTDSNGHAPFVYTAPNNLPATSLTITFEVKNGSPALTKDVTVNFNGSTSGADVNTTNYQLVAVPNVVDVTNAGETKNIDLYLNDMAALEPVEGKVIKARVFDQTNGTLDTYEVTTDDNGHAGFMYTAPNTLPATSLTITFEVKNGSPALTKDVTVNFNGSTSGADVNTTNYELVAVPFVVDIATGGESADIDLYLNDTNLQSPVKGKVIKAQVFNQTNGTLNTYEVTTDDNGHAPFVYTAPNTLPATSLTITFEVKGGVPALEQNVTVNFGSSSSSFTYAIYLDANFTVTQPSESHTIKVALEQNENNTTAPAVGKTVVAEFIMPMYGTLAQYEAQVGLNGIATFEYTAPDHMPDVNETNITFYYKDDHSVMGQTTVIFDRETVMGVENLYVVPQSFTVTNPGQEQNITIITVNSENVGVSATVQLEQPNNGTDYGSFNTTNVTTDASGKAVVLYTAPGSITGLSERNITVTELSANISKELNIKFGTPDTLGTNYEIVVQTPQALAVDGMDQITVKIQELDNPSNVIADGNVHEVNLTSQFTNILTFAGNSADYTYNNSGTKAIEVDTKTVSGVAVIAISASIYNGDHDVVLTKLVPVTVLSGPVTAMSLFYVSSSQNSVGEFINTYTIHAVDKYANPAREGVVLSPSLINGTKITENNTSATGRILAGTDPVEFRDSNVGFSAAGVDTTDRLIIVPNSVNSAETYLGNWTIDTVGAHYLYLSEAYYDVTTNGLSYIVGNEDRDIIGYGKATADIKGTAGSYVTDANGNVQFDITFDPILAGHTVTVAAHTYDGNRTGVAKVAGLRWGNYSSTTVTVDNNGSSYPVTLSLGINDIGGNGLEPLVDVDIVPEGILSSSSQCGLDTSASNDLHTDENGQISVWIYTKGTDGDIKECDISWSKSNAHIYREY